ncbi:3-oxoacyl-ACP synthase III family protein [Streptomyces sp. H34-S4]|uniref:3-oxoacyl-ACP synthase III family protein n=1 Tax=Streptomyces sp. H34-S4 TaxID=2996463 RepID=UPI00226DA3A6|nr:hypothetical protein [Streptomyces sp. H34-S4]MCY0938149.1 hypothetical protein [Streptomyces sp. H34-S4]
MPRRTIRRSRSRNLPAPAGRALQALKLARDILSAFYPDGHALVIGAEMFSKFQNPTDRSTGVLFADGAGAVVVGPAAEGTGILCSTQGTDGAFADIVGIGAGGSARPTSEHTLSEGGHYPHMNGKAVAACFHEIFPRINEELVQLSGLPLDQIDLVIPHKANPRMPHRGWRGNELGRISAALAVTPCRRPAASPQSHRTLRRSRPPALRPVRALRSCRGAGEDRWRESSISGGCVCPKSRQSWIS